MPVRLNLGCGKKHLPRELGWRNVDKFSNVGADEVVDLFTYPWPWADNSVDEFNASHLVEHIPHEPKPSGRVNAPDSTDPVIRELASIDTRRWNELKGYDGFYCFFGEVWRIAKPGAKMHITVPYGLTYGALQDPTHTRYIVPQSFAYLTAEMVGGADFDYSIPCLFKVTEARFDVPVELQNDLDKFAERLPHEFNLTRNMYVELEVIKDGDENIYRPKTEGPTPVVEGS